MITTFQLSCTTIKRLAFLVALGVVVGNSTAPAPALAFQEQSTTQAESGATWSLTGLPARDLTVGMNGEDVKALQYFLIYRRHRIEASATGYFGLQTQAALAEYQRGAQIQPSAGYFGVITRRQMKEAELAGVWW